MLNSKAAEDFIDALSKSRNLDFTDLQRVVNGGKDFGTWFHEDVALEYARWLSPKFAIWCNDHIKELLRTGSTSISLPMDYETALEQLLVKVKENKRLALENRQQTQYIAENQAHVDFAKQVAVSVHWRIMPFR